VVAVVEDKESVGAAQYIELKVYRSPTDPNRILGSWRFAAGGPIETVIDQSRPETTVDVEFHHAVDCADQNGIPFVWVNDPEELFPPFTRY
jgi:hypothetical protein